MPLNTHSIRPSPRLTGPGEWCEEHKLHLDALMTRNAVYLNRRQQTAYELTLEGQKAFARVVGMQSMNGYASTMNTDESKPLGLLSPSERFAVIEVPGVVQWHKRPTISRDVTVRSPRPGPNLFNQDPN